MSGFKVIFADVADPRDYTSRHLLHEILFIALAASLCGADDCVAYAEFGRARETWLRQFLTLPCGVPSHDTFTRVFRLLDPAALEAALQRFVAALGQALAHTAGRGVVAIDGKSLKRGYEKGCQHMPPLTVSAFFSQTRIVLAQTLAEGGSEIEGTLKLLEMIELKDAVVTADALHCHKRMVQALRDKGAHYAIALKANRRSLWRAAKQTFEDCPDLPTAETLDEAHGRSERRRASVVRVNTDHGLPGLRAFGRIETWRTVTGKTEHAVRTYVLSKAFTPQELLEIVREHWSIENCEHWTLDVVFNEDRSRTRKDNGPRNLAVMRRITLNILRTHSDKKSLRIKRSYAAWNDAYLSKLMTHVR